MSFGTLTVLPAKIPNLKIFTRVKVFPFNVFMGKAGRVTSGTLNVPVKVPV